MNNLKEIFNSIMVRVIKKQEQTNQEISKTKNLIEKAKVINNKLKQMMLISSFCYLKIFKNNLITESIVNKLCKIYPIQNNHPKHIFHVSYINN